MRSEVQVLLSPPNEILFYSFERVFKVFLVITFKVTPFKNFLTTFKIIKKSLRFKLSTIKRKNRKTRFLSNSPLGELAQLGERLLCTQEVSGSIPLFSTKVYVSLFNVFDEYLIFVRLE